MVTTRSSRTAATPESRREGETLEASNTTKTSPSAADSATKNTLKKKSPSARKSLSATKRSRQKELEQSLRLKSTGLGLSISVNKVDGKGNTSSTNRRTVFQTDAHDDEDETPNTLSNKLEKSGEQKAASTNANDESDGDHDDDAVEEIKHTAAREEILAQRLNERVSAAVVTSMHAKRRKRKSKLHDTEKDTAGDGDDDDEDLADDFFEQLDAELKQEHKAKKRKARGSQHEAKPMGKHTTFLAKGDDAVDSTIKVNDNIELVVFNEGDDDNKRVDAVSSLSKQALIYSRGHLVDGKDKLSEKKRQQAKKAGRKNVEAEGWVRSNKMNRLLAPGRVSMRKQGKGGSAPRFVVQGSS